MAYSLDLRERIVEAVAEGQKHQDVAARFKVGVATVRRYLRRSRLGELVAKTLPGRSALIPAEAYELLSEQVRQHNDATLAKHGELWEAQQGVKVSVVVMCRTLQRAGISRKKTLRAGERSEAQRLCWLAKACCLDPGKLVFVDESGFQLAMTPLYARAPKGQRACSRVPRNRGANTSFVAALSLNGLQAPMTLQGSVDGIAFETYVEQVLLPTLTPGQVVVLDNHRIHKGDRIAKLLSARGCSLLFLPPYSPDLNPIEEALSKIKTFVKKCQARARDALNQAIAAALKTITLQDILGWFGHSGYNLRYQ